ncbi:MAG: alkaline phosphatase D family protein [Acidobacteriota bacterium]|nr:alkaline phosphatase D family protein [Acidobacteriota bacterium]
MQEFKSSFVGAVSEHSARLWLRTKTPGPFKLELFSKKEKNSTYATIADQRSADADDTMAFTIPDDVPSVGNLTPATEYKFRITVSATDDVVGEGRFETAPPKGTKGKFAFAFMSCHQPFNGDGSVNQDSKLMMSALEPALTARGVKYLLLIGDQIYADSPNPKSIFQQGNHSSSPKESLNDFRARYQNQYRLFWSFPEMQRLQSNFPSWCIWDDHEIVDDWGTKQKHLEPQWQTAFDGAKRAFADYQFSRTMPFTSSLSPSFHQSFVWGATGTFIFDLCSERFFDGHISQVYGDMQLAALTSFLQQQQNQSIVFVVLTVPLVYLPDWFVAMGERVPKYSKVFATRWNAAQNRKSLEQLLDVLRQHKNRNPKQKLVLLSGDVHQSSALKLSWQTGEQAYQFVSSAVTNAQRNWKQKLAHRIALSMSAIRHGSQQINIERLNPVLAGQQNPFGGLNIGIVHVDDDISGPKLRLEIITCDKHLEGRELVAFDSGWL